jgi:hypothetical protein
VTLTGIDPKGFVGGAHFGYKSTMGKLGRRAGSRHFRDRHEGIDREHVDRLDCQHADSL